jgi:hypothetical protein
VVVLHSEWKVDLPSRRRSGIFTAYYIYSISNVPYLIVVLLKPAMFDKTARTLVK